MKKTIIAAITIISFSLISSAGFAAKLGPAHINPNVPKYDLAIGKGMIDYRGDNKVLEFVIKNKGSHPSPNAQVIFKRNGVTSKKLIKSVKGGGHQIKIKFIFPYAAGAKKYMATIAIKDANLKNNQITGTE